MTGRPISCFTLIKHSANALIPEAEEAMPELCGKLLEVCISKSSAGKGKSAAGAFEKRLNFG